MKLHRKVSTSKRDVFEVGKKYRVYHSRLLVKWWNVINETPYSVSDRFILYVSVSECPQTRNLFPLFVVVFFLLSVQALLWCNGAYAVPATRLPLAAEIGKNTF